MKGNVNISLRGTKVRVVMSSDFQLCSEHSDVQQHQVTLIHVNSEQFGGYHGYTECVSQRGCGCGELESGSWDTDEVCFPIAERSPDM